MGRSEYAKKARHKRSQSKDLTYSQRKREKMDYRYEYFKRNPGLFGKIYFCAYCKRPLLRKDVQVDHIMPLNNALGRNVRYNLVAACGNCNRRKSDKVDGRVVIGYVSKATDTAMYAAQSAVVYTMYGALRVIAKVLFGCGVISLVIWALILLTLILR